jgi:iron complex outermembrane receptor protein
LNKLVPSVNLNGSLNGRVPAGIRGISSVSNEATIGLSSGVAFLIDGVPIPSDSVAASQLEDVQSVEVLKGPQATLGGRTAASGVINIVTRGPTRTLTGDMSATGTNDGEYRLNGFLAGPLFPDLDFSLSAYYNQRDYPIRNIQLDKRTTQDTSGARGKLLYHVTDDLDITLTGHFGYIRNDGANFVYSYLSPGSTLLVGTGGPPFLSPATLLPGITPTATNQLYSSPVRAYARSKDRDVSLNIEYRLGELTFGSVTAYQHEVQNNAQDLFAVATYFWNELSGAPAGGTPPYYNLQYISENINQLSQEFKLASPTDRPLSYLLGAFYSDTRVRYTQSRDFLPAFANVDVTPSTSTYDVYARATWKLLPQTSVVGGLRYNYDKLSYTDRQLLYTFSFPPPVILPDQFASDHNGSSTVVGDISLQQRLGTDSMAYLTYARGYSPAAYNTSQSIDTTGTTTSPAKLSLVAKETVDHFEIGAKNSFFDRSVTLNVAIFDTKYTNFQIQNFDKSSTAINPPLILVAAGEAETRGVEIDSAWAATAGLRIGLNAAYIRAKFNDYPNAPCAYGTTTSPPGTPTCTQDLAGKPLPNAPRFKLSGNFEERIPLGFAPLDLTLAGNYSYRTAAQMLTDQNPQTVLPGFGILDLAAGVVSTSKTSYSVTAFVNNVTNKFYAVDVEDFWSAPWGGTNTVIMQPARDARRYYGLRVNVGF